MNKLDNYDCELISLFKQGSPTINELKKFWAKRCGLSKDYPGAVEAIANRLLKIVYFIGFNNDFCFIEFIKNLNDSEQWKFVTIHNNKDLRPETPPVQKFWENVIRVAGSYLTLTKVKELPGYEEYLQSLTP